MISQPTSILESIRDWADEEPERVAVMFQPIGRPIETITYRELWGRSQKIAALYQHLPHKSRMGLIAAHGPEFLVEALAILSAGHCLVPINGGLSRADREEIADRAGIHALRQSGKTGCELSRGQPIDLAEDADYRALDPAYLRFTSGSTGRQKGVLLSHRTVMERTAAANARLKISPADRVLCLLPMVDHFVVSILLYLRYGATILLVADEADAPVIAKTAKATVLYGSPMQYRRFREPLPDLRLAVATTQGLSLAIANDFLAKTGQPLSQALGIIEAGLLTLNDENAANNPLLAGLPMPAYQLSIAEEGSSQGEICVSGPGLLDAYVSPWLPRVSLLGERGLPTGDHGWIDDAGYLHLVGRGKNKITVDGIPFFYEEIEAIINSHSEVEESMVYQLNGQLVAEVVARDKRRPAADLLRWINDNLPGLRSPIRLELVEILPLTPTGKLARPADRPNEPKTPLISGELPGA